MLHAGVACPLAREVQLPLNAEAFSALLPLLRHGAIDADGAPAFEPDFAVRLASAFTETRVKRFVASAQNLADETRLAIRNRAVYLRTENPLTARFIPPAAGNVGAVLGTALISIETALELHRGHAGKTAVCALLGSQILLTIHPFGDGNGRTARMFFAAQLLRHLGPAPTALLGMLLMHRAGAHQYHQASWALRAGDAEPMVALFVGSEKLAHERLFQGSATTLSQAGFLERCWSELQALR